VNIMGTMPEEGKVVHRDLLVAVVVSWGLSAVSTQGAETASGGLGIVSRSIVQDRGDWQVDYRLRHDGSNGQLVSMDEVFVRVEGWVSNSRVPGHAVPRNSALVISSPGRLQATSDVIGSDDEEARCRERASLSLWAEDAQGRPVGRVLEPSVPGNARGDAAAAVLSLAPGTTFHVSLRLSHQHVIYGAYDPLLGLRAVELRLGSAMIRDVLPLDREQHVAVPPRPTFDVPEEHRDTQYYRSVPDSLHVSAHLPGNAYFRFAEIPVRYDTKMRLRFSYLVAAGSEGTCRARITQFKDSPVAWKVLADGRRDIDLAAVGRWTTVELIFRTDPRATTLALDFRIEGDLVEVGEFWVDDVSLEPVGAASADP
jgi:hypothetical protein